MCSWNHCPLLEHGHHTWKFPLAYLIPPSNPAPPILLSGNHSSGWFFFFGLKYICVNFLGFYTNSVTEYGFVWILSPTITLRIMHVVSCIRNFLLLSSNPLYCYTIICWFAHHFWTIWVDFRFQLFQIKLLWMFMRKSLYWHIYFHLSWINT